MRLVALSIFAVAALLRTFAQTEWTRATDGLWNDPQAWSSGVPSANSSLTRIGNVGTKTITIDRSIAAANLRVGRFELLGSAGGTNALLVSGLGATPFRVENSFNISEGGVLRILNSPAVFDGAVSGGSFSLNAGELYLDGGLFEVIGSVTRIGRTGSGLARVNAGELRTGSDLIVGGISGSEGKLEIYGGNVSAAGILYVGDNAGSSGNVIVSAGSLACGSMRIGDDGSGMLLVNGGTVHVDDVSVGRAAGSDGTWTIQSGEVQCGDLSIGRFGASAGLVQISGGRLSLTNDTVFVGREGTGELRVSGGELNALELVVAATNSAQGSIQLSGGSVKVGSLIAKGAQAGINFQSGILTSSHTEVNTGEPFIVGDGVAPATLRLEAGTHVFAQGLIISPNARLEGCGTILGPITMRGTDGRCATGGTRTVATIQRQGADVTIQSDSEPGKIYRVEVSSTLMPDSWMQTAPEIAGTGSSIAFSIRATAPIQFYRIVAR